METYKSRRAFSDQYLPQVKALIGQEIIEESSFEDDTQHAIDLRVYSTRISVRIRQMKYASKYADFTLRATAKEGLSEYAKLLRSRGLNPDYIFYGFADQEVIMKAYLIDVLALRRSIKSGVDKKFIRNPDGSGFVALPLHEAYCKTLK